MQLLCWAHFPPKRRGRNRVWTSDNYIKLLQDTDRTKVEYRIKSERKAPARWTVFFRKAAGRRATNAAPATV